MNQVVSSKAERIYRADTLEDYHRDVLRAIEVMHARLREPLTVNDLADAAIMSRFHFLRVFSHVTGVTPARFLRLLRLQEAKRLLVESTLSVTEVSLAVGYNSLGTFVTVFTEAVGYTPLRFRRLSKSIQFVPFARQLTSAIVKPSTHRSCTRDLVRGVVVCNDALILTVAAIFREEIPQSRPRECCAIQNKEFSFRNRGNYVFVAGLRPTASIVDALLMNPAKLVVGVARLEFDHNGFIDLSVPLQTPLPTDPPILYAFPLNLVSATL